jgi:hypothetical protein
MTENIMRKYYEKKTQVCKWSKEKKNNSRKVASPFEDYS